MELVEVIEPRVEEIFEHVKRELMRSGYADSLAAGVVLTGGATCLEGTCEVAEQVLGLPCRRGYPSKVGGLVDVVKSPAYSTGVGLVVYGAAHGRQAATRSREAQLGNTGLIKRAWSRLAEMF